ncbi:MAG TPA: putative Ig domain-containing protein [Blastocatellia bacterium]|nr:putative Ig domain-containing protein [Blastocatellia bacterium]
MKFSLKMCVPSGDAKNIMIKDYLPAPIFDLSTLSVTNFVKTPSTVNATLNQLVLSTLDNSALFIITPGQILTDPFVTNPTTPTCFEIQFEVTVANVALQQPLSVTNYLVTKTVNSAGVEDSHTTGVVLTVGQGNPVLTITKSVCAIGPGNVGTTVSGTINNAGNVDNADAADKLTYCITITNNSQVAAQQVVFKDEVPAGLTYVPNSRTVTPGAFDNSIPLPKLQTQQQPLAPGQTITVTYMATVNNTAAPCQPKITNTAKVEWLAGQATASATDTADVSFAKPTIMKTVKGQPTNPKATIGEEITYEIKVCLPEGTTPAFTIQDIVPSNLTCLSATVSGLINGTLACSGTWNIPSLSVPADNNPNNDCIIIELKARVRDIAANMGMPGNQTTITNTALLSVPGCATQSASVDVVVVEPKLTIDKEMKVGSLPIPPATVTPGATVTVTLTITNTGTSSAFNVKVDDFLPPNLINPKNDPLSPSDFVFSTNQITNVVTYQGGEVKPGTNNKATLVFTVQAHVPCQQNVNLAAINAASTLPLPEIKTDERTYANITDSVDFEVKCECTTPPYLNTKGMTAWWTFDEASSSAPALDIANAQNDGTKINTSFSSGELVKGSLLFNGNAYVKVPGNQADLQFGKGDFSIDAWIKPPSAPAATTGIRPIVDKTGLVLIGTGTLALSGYTLFLDNGHLRARVGTTLYPSNNTTGPHLGDNKWHHIALTVHRPFASQLVLYVDGTPIFTTTAVSIASVTNIADLTIGRGNQVTNLFKDYFNGRIDEVELFNRELTQQNVTAIYRAGSAGKCKPVCMLSCPPTTLATATVNQTYSPQPIIAGGTASYSYDPVALPPGMNLGTDGKLTGKPIVTGTYKFTIVATDQNGCSKTCDYTITVVCGGLTISNPTVLPNGSLGGEYNQMLTSTDGCGGYVFKQIGGLLPPGVTLTPDGKLFGPGLKYCGTYEFTVQVTDKCGCTGTKAFSITVEGSPMAISDAFNTGVNDDKTVRSLGQPELSNHYAATVNGNPITVSVIPKQQAWVSPTGAAAWIGPGPAQGGNLVVYTLKVDLTNCIASTIQLSGQYAASGSGYITINGNTTQLFPTGTNGASSFTGFTLPASSFTSNAVNLVRFHVTAPTGGVASGLLVELLTATKKCCPCQIAVGPDILPDGKAGTAYTGQFTVTGGVPPYTYTVTGNPMPPGIGVGQDGKISGTPVLCGEYTLIVKVTDSQGCMGVRVYKFKVRCSDVVIDYNPDENPSSGLVEQQQPTTSFLTARIYAQILGNEKTIYFSLGVDPKLLSNPLVSLGSGARNATLDVNTTELDVGNLGISITQPDGILFAEGRQEVAVVTWEFTSSDRGRATQIEFRDSPVSPAIINQNGVALETQFKPTPVVLASKAAIVSAASYGGERLAPEQIVAAFGLGLATATQVATTVPLPTTLAGTTIKVRDSANVERLAPLFFVAPTQINYLIPPGTAAGTASIIITSGNGTVSGAVVEIANVAPGVFVADASGRGVPAANALTFRADGSSSSTPVAQFDPITGRFVAVPINLGALGDRVFLSLYATGVRKRSSLENVRAIINGVEAPLQYAGDQGGFVGLDQVNIELPRSLAGSGLVEVVLIVDGAIANTVQVNIQ